MWVTIFMRDAFSSIYFMMKFYKILPKPEILEQQRLNNKVIEVCIYAIEVLFW